MNPFRANRTAVDHGRTLRGAGAALAGVLALTAAGLAAAQDRPVDLELVLAVDASGSVSDEEFNLQLHGLAEAFRDRSVSQAIRATGDLGDGPHGRIPTSSVLPIPTPSAIRMLGRSAASARWAGTI